MTVRKVFNIIIFYINQLLTFIIEFFQKSEKRKLPPITNKILLSSINELQNQIKSGELTVEKIISAYYDRVEAVNPFINAVVYERFQLALNEARTLDAKIFNELNGIVKNDGDKVLHLPLLGIPFTCKNITSFDNRICDVGSFHFKNQTSEKDENVIKQLRNAGAIPIVITNTPEVSFWMASNNLVHGNTKNPYDLSRIVGGSSGGEGALISAAGSLFGIGSDVAGSIRIPALFNGLYGHKTTTGVLPSQGMHHADLGPFTKLLSLGPICRYASDIIPALKGMGDQNINKLNLDEPVDISKLKLYYVKTTHIHPLVPAVQPEISSSIQKALKYLKNKFGCEIIELDMDEDLYKSLSFVNASLKSLRPHTMEFELSGRKYKVNILLELMKSIFGLSTHTKALLLFAILEKLTLEPDEEGFDEILIELENFRKKLHQKLNDTGVLFYPVLPESACKHYAEVCKSFGLAYSALANIINFTATSIPAGLDKKDIPVGFQIMATPYNDRLPIALACELDNLFGGWIDPSRKN